MSNHDHTQNLDNILQTISSDDLATTTGATGGAIAQQLKTFAQPVLDLALPLAQPIVDLALPLAQPVANLAMPIAQPFVDLFNKFVPAI